MLSQLFMEEEYIGFGDQIIQKKTWHHWRKTGKKSYHRDFPGSPVVKTLPSDAGGAASIPCEGAKIEHASQPKKQKHNKWKPYC